LTVGLPHGLDLRREVLQEPRDESRDHIEAARDVWWNRFEMLCEQQREQLRRCRAALGLRSQRIEKELLPAWRIAQLELRRPDR
jgi:hypothetical protein